MLTDSEQLSKLLGGGVHPIGVEREHPGPASRAPLVRGERPPTDPERTIGRAQSLDLADVLVPYWRGAYAVTAREETPWTSAPSTRCSPPPASRSPGCGGAWSRSTGTGCATPACVGGSGRSTSPSCSPR